MIQPMHESMHAPCDPTRSSVSSQGLLQIGDMPLKVRNLLCMRLLLLLSTSVLHCS